MLSFKITTRKLTAVALAVFLAAGCSNNTVNSSDQNEHEHINDVNSSPLTNISSETHDEDINIVTDNRDIPLAENVITYDEAISVVDNEVDTDTSADSSNPMPESKPVETKPTDNKEDEKPTNPAGIKSSDGKYTLTETDIENPDGTYSETFTKDTVDPVTGEIVTAEEIKTWGLDDYKSNPSQIPYSQ